MNIRGLRWYIAALLFLASAINYIDRQALSVAAPLLTKELHIDAIQYSNILQTFLIAYAVMYLGSGFLVDRWGTRISLAVFMAWWSASNMLHAFASNALQLGVFRFLLGVGEPGGFMAAIRVASEWFPPKERALVNGLSNAGASVGAIIAAPLMVWLMLRFGWRSAFVITGALGFVWLAAWLFFNRPPVKPIEEPTGKDISKAALLRYPQTWGLLLARFISDPVWWFYLFWLPKYLVEQRGFSLTKMGMLAWLPYLCADLGSIAGGWMSSWLVQRNWPVLGARRAAMLPCAAVMPLSVVIAFTPSATVALVLICIVTFAHMAWKTNLVTITNDIYPVRVVGSVSGIVAFGSGLGGTLFTNLTGQMVQHFSYTWIFVLMGFLHPAAYGVFRLFVRKRLAQEI